MVSSKNQKTSRAQKAAAASTARPTAPKPAKAKADYSLEDLLDKVGALAEQMEYPLAIKFAKRATEIDPEGAGTWEVLGSLYAETGETERGREVRRTVDELWKLFAGLVEISAIILDSYTRIFGAFGTRHSKRLRN